MSSLIVFHLPKTITQKDLKDIFSRKGDVTKVQLVFTVDGSSCYFAMISYETEEEAKAALNYFDKSYIHSSRISVERCSEMKDKNETETSAQKTKGVSQEMHDKKIGYDNEVNNTVATCLPSYLKNLPYEKGQWSYTNPNGNKVYSKSFLIKLGSEIVCQKNNDRLLHFPQIANYKKEKNESQKNSLEKNKITTVSDVSFNYDFSKSSVAYLLANKQMDSKN